MATIENRSRFQVSVKHREDFDRQFSFDKLKGVESYVADLRSQGYKPRVQQAEDMFLVRIRQKGYDPLQVTLPSREQADAFVQKIEEERSRGLFIDYTKAHKVTFAELLVRYLEEEAPKLAKSQDLLFYKIEGWLEDSGADGLSLLESHRTKLRSQGKAVREAKFKMREVSTCIIWIHKRLSEVETIDIEDYIEERLQCVAPATVDRELDILRAVFTVGLKVWNFSVARNPMDAVRRPRYFNERERRLKPGEEKTLLDCLSAIDRERAVEQRLHDSAELAMRGDSYSSLSARKKVLAEVRKQLRPTAELECQPVPLLEAFAHFQLMTAARRSESLGLAWDSIDFESGTAFLPETKNGRSRKLSLRAAAEATR